MPRIARFIVPGVPHHVTQRGNRRQRTFLRDNDYQAYVRLLGKWRSACNVTILAYCLMPNHVHLIAVPIDKDGLGRMMRSVHQAHAARINAREGWQGHLWQDRYHSFPMDERHTLVAARYIELNPIAAGLADDDPAKWPWSSAAAHLNGRDDFLVSVAPLLDQIDDWREFLWVGQSEHEAGLFSRHERSGRPLGDGAFLRRMEEALGHPLPAVSRGRPRKK